MLWHGMMRSAELAGVFDERVGARRRPVEDGDAMAFFGDVERKVGAHHAKADQPDVGVSHCASLFVWFDVIAAVEASALRDD